jgi:endonuclease III
MALPFRDTIAALRRLYGKPPPPFSTDPFELIVYENIAYLASDEKRGEAFASLRRDVGVTPRAILKASNTQLARACRIGGIYPERRAERLRRSAEIVVSRFDGDLRSVLRLPQKEARKALQRFPTIGEPGADKILLFCGGHPVVAPESNGLRVLVRLGFVHEESSYGATYRAALASIASEAGRDRRFLIAAHLLLRRHGQELCRRSRPDCPMCPLRARCDYYHRI